ncbi:MAG: hypothetical protein ACRYFW_14780 [Janthinobacterium lividum]
MANARDLERLLTLSGMSPVKLDTGNRQLRESGDLPTAGRGLYAPPISGGDAAAVLIAYAGSGKANRTGARLAKLRSLKSSADGRTLLAVVRCLLEEPINVRELRISRVRGRARLLLEDGTEVTFTSSQPKPALARFETEGVLDSHLIAAVAALLRDEPPMISPADEPEDSE